jgi:hypothetical protein
MIRETVMMMLCRTKPVEPRVLGKAPCGYWRRWSVPRPGLGARNMEGEIIVQIFIEIS